MKLLNLVKTFVLGLTALTSLTSMAEPTNKVTTLAPQPTTCLQSSFSSTGDQWWKNITLKLTNLCNQTVDMQNATITFLNKIPLSTTFWGDFGSLSYPDNQLVITSQPSGDNHLASLNLHFPTYEGANSKLVANKSIFLRYGAKSEGHIGDANIYLGNAVNTGSIEITNSSQKPANVSQNYALVHISANGVNVANTQVPWNGVQMVNGLANGSYTLAADSVTATDGSVYQGAISPATINVISNAVAKTTVVYTVVNQTGKLAINLRALPSELMGYTENPSTTIREIATGSSTTLSLMWGANATATNLKDGSSYSFSTPSINYNGYTCDPISLRKLWLLAQHLQ